MEASSSVINSGLTNSQALSTVQSNEVFKSVLSKGKQVIKTLHSLKDGLSTSKQSDHSQLLEEIFSKTCEVRVLLNMNMRMALNGEKRIDNVGVNYFSKAAPKCSDSLVKEEFDKYIIKNNLNNDAKLVIIPWKKGEY